MGTKANKALVFFLRKHPLQVLQVLQVMQMLQKA